MNNHIYRHGLMGKKTGDGRRRIYLHKEKPSTRQPNYDQTIISGRANMTGSCGFRHAPYISDIDLGDADAAESAVDPSVDGPIFAVWTTVALLTEAAKSCEFCYTIWLGLQQYRFFWESKWNRLNYLYALQDHVDEYTEEEYYSLANENLYGFEPVAGRLVDERRIFLSLSYERKLGYLKARLLIEPRGNSTYDRNERMISCSHSCDASYVSSVICTCTIESLPGSLLG